MSSNLKIPRVCQQCGKTFIARTTVTKNCSDECAKKAYKVRQREKKINESNQETMTVLKGTHNLATPQSREYLSIPDITELLGIGERTIRRMIKDKRLNALKVGRKYIVRKNDLDKLFE